MKRFCLVLAALASLLIPGAVAVHAVVAQNHVVKVADSDRDAQKWTWVPEVVDVKVGDTVTWDMNGAQVAHTATADDGSWDSGYVNPGSKWTHKFGTVGEIHYHCTPHPWKKGVIRVQPVAAQPPVTNAARVAAAKPPATSSAGSLRVPSTGTTIGLGGPLLVIAGVGALMAALRRRRDA